MRAINNLNIIKSVAYSPTDYIEASFIVKDSIDTNLNNQNL
jgi:hypothetical protein